jgi:hypothetical protein
MTKDNNAPFVGIAQKAGEPMIHPSRIWTILKDAKKESHESASTKDLQLVYDEYMSARSAAYVPAITIQISSEQMDSIITGLQFMLHSGEMQLVLENLTYHDPKGMYRNKYHELQELVAMLCDSRANNSEGMVHGLTL